ncbi:hypothetical protein [Paenibacillus sp. WC2504]|uniref:hypothetical protein n=1 Tax=Paenibacillus sp. WC2504 TaxID=3461403 RepID=UPI0040456AAB
MANYSNRDTFDRLLSLEWEMIRKEQSDRGRIPLNKPSLNRMVERYSTQIDRIITQSIKHEGLSFVSGKFTIEIIGSTDYFRVAIEAYFLKEDKDWVLKTHTSDQHIGILAPGSIAKLRELKEMAFEITNPLQH